VVSLLGVGLDAVGDRIGYMLLGDHTGHIAPARNSASANDHRHDRFATPHTTDDVEDRILLCHHGKIVASDIPQAQARSSALQSSTKACVDANYAAEMIVYVRYRTVCAPYSWLNASV
jgi:hypothetical protein